MRPGRIHKTIEQLQVGEQDVRWGTILTTIADLDSQGDFTEFQKDLVRTLLPRLQKMRYPDDIYFWEPSAEVALEWRLTDEVVLRLFVADSELAEWMLSAPNQDTVFLFETPSKDEDND
jgi:hypothetical protein